MCDSGKCTFSLKCHKENAKCELASIFHATKLLKKTPYGVEPVDDAETFLKNKVLALYFSGHWCPPCRQFTPILKKFYQAVGDEEFEIIFLSKDHSKDEYEKYIQEAQGDWCVLPFEDPLIEKLQTRYDVQSVPTLVILKQNGDAILKNAWAVVQNATRTPIEQLSLWKKQF